MHNAITSRHIRSSSELFLMVPIKTGFVPISDGVLTYASRVSAVLSALFELRKQKIESNFGEPAGPIELLQTIYRVQWTVIKPWDDAPEDGHPVWGQLKGPQLVLTSHFDSSWEHYFYDLASTGGPLLDLIFSHCVGYEGHSCNLGDGYEAFSEFIRSHQRPCDFLFAASPEITVDDLRYFKRVLTTLPPSSELAAGKRTRSIRDETQELGEQILKTHVEGAKTAKSRANGGELRDDWAGSKNQQEWTQSILRAVYALHDIWKRLFSPDDDGIEGIRERQLYENAIGSVLSIEPDVHRLEVALTPLKKAGQLPSEPVRWLLGVLKKDKKEEEADEADKLPPRIAAYEVPAAGEVQRRILGTEDGVTHAALLLLHFRDRAALRSLLVQVDKSKSTWGGTDPSFVNLALTYSGIQRAALGAQVERQFPREFAEGMEERAALIGDVGENHPRYWERPLLESDAGSRNENPRRVQLRAIDAALLVYADSEEERERLVLNYEELKAEGVSIVHRSDLHRAADPFGFKDKVSQPNPLPEVGALKTIDDTALGEFLLGYPDRNGRTAACADDKKNEESSELFKNGTFLVVRKMMQDKAAFAEYVANVEKKLEVTPPVAHTFIVGRTREGTLRKELAEAAPRTAGAPEAAKPNPNNFDFDNDPKGAICPFHSHIRRTNPREPGTPRILRRGLSYGPEDQGEEVGSLFMAYNASIAEQYEVIQRYVNGANSNGISSFQNDLLCGARGPNGIPRWVSPSGDGNDLKRMPDLPDRPLVVLRWGLYLFVPSHLALQYLLDRTREAAAPASEEPSCELGRQRIKELDAMRDRAAVKNEWKRLLEEVPEAGSTQAREADEVWAAIRAVGGVKRVSRGLVIVAGMKAANEVLANDGSKFSVSTYAERMKFTIGDHYLAHDVKLATPVPGPSYAELSKIPNEQLDSVTLDAFLDAFNAAVKILDDPDDLQHELPGRGRSSLSIRDLARAVVGKLCQQWFGMPGKGERHQVIIATLERFLLTSRYTFQFDPGERLVADAKREGGSIPAQYGLPSGCPFAQKLKDAKYDANDDTDKLLTRQAIVGAVVGFAPPTVGAVTRILDRWIEDDQFWRLQLDMGKFVGQAHTLSEKRAKHGAEEVLRQDVLKERERRAPLIREIYDSLAMTPSPPILYRTAVKALDFHGVRIAAGAQVVIPLKSVYDDARKDKGKGKRAPEVWLFGGEHGTLAKGDKNPAHGCPVRPAGADVIAGIAAALFARTNVKRERRFVLSYDAKKEDEATPEASRSK